MTFRVDVACFLAASALFAGCQDVKIKQTDFLSDYSKLERVDDTFWMYENPKARLRSYDKFIVEPVAVRIDANQKENFSEEELEGLAEHFHDALVRELKGHYQIVAEPGPATARVRVALTDIMQDDTLLNILPVSRLTGAGFGGAAMEGELVDSESGTQIGAVLQCFQGGTFSSVGLGKLSDARAGIDTWVENFAQRLREAREEGAGKQGK